MEVRITYVNEIYLKGNTLEEIKRKWENLDLTIASKQDEAISGFNYIDTIAIEDADFNDLEKEWSSI